MANELTAEKLAQRALDVNIVTEAELRSVWGELGTRNVEYEQFKTVAGPARVDYQLSVGTPPTKLSDWFLLR